MIDEILESLRLGLAGEQIVELVTKFVGDIAHHETDPARPAIEQFHGVMGRIINDIDERITEYDFHFLRLDGNLSY